MKAYIINQLPNRLIFADDEYYVYFTPEEYNLIANDNHKIDNSMIGIHKEYLTNMVSIPQLVDANVLRELDFSKLSVAQVTGLLKL